MTIGFGRIDGPVVAPDSSFVYLEHIADNRIGNVTCATDAECGGDEFCHQGRLCGPYFYGIGSGGGELWASGVCGTATAVHRAALEASLLPTAYTNHDRHISSYEYPGADAEVWWSGAAPGATGQHYKFWNDSGGSIVLVTTTRMRGSDLEATLQLWGTNLDARWSEHTIVDLGGSRTELRRKLTRVGDAPRTSPPLSFEGTGNIRRLSTTSEILPDGKTATTEEWRIDSSYEGPITAPDQRFLSRNHPDQP
jgi:hypothetical protein